MLEPFVALTLQVILICPFLSVREVVRCHLGRVAPPPACFASLSGNLGLFWLIHAYHILYYFIMVVKKEKVLRDSFDRSTCHSTVPGISSKNAFQTRQTYFELTGSSATRTGRSDLRLKEKIKNISGFLLIVHGKKDLVIES